MGLINTHESKLHKIFGNVFMENIVERMVKRRCHWRVSTAHSMPVPSRAPRGKDFFT